MNTWKKGKPPQDERIYEVKQRYRNAGGHLVTGEWAERAFWHNGHLVRRSQFHGKLVNVIGTNRWRVARESEGK